MGLTKVSGDILQTPLNVGVVTATRIDGNVSGNVNSTGVSTFTTLKVGTGVTISGGIVTATSFVGNVTGNATGLSGTPNITVGSITASSATITGNVSVAGTVTYDDVTNVDSIGVITARSGVVIGTGASISSPTTNVLTLGTNNIESVRIDSSGRLGIGTNNPAVNLEVRNTSPTLRVTGNSATNPTITLSSATITSWSQTVSGTDSSFSISKDGTERLRITSSGHTLPGADNTYDLGASGTRWRNIYTADLQMSNEGSKNDVDGTWGKYTIQEGENDLFLINRRTGKRYKFLLEEVK